MRPNPSSAIRKKSGQAIVFLLVVLVVASLAVLWNFDLHNVVSTKIRVDNAGDAGALEAARWQGITLNMIGDLNLAQAAFICDKLSQRDPTSSNDVAEVQALEELQTIANLRTRLSLTGPLMGYAAAQAAAMMNLNERDIDRREDSFANYLAQRGGEFVNSGGSFMGMVPQPYDGAWEQYGQLLEAIAQNPMVVECATRRYFVFYDGSHILLDPDFYEAVAYGDWCWFVHHAQDLLEGYSSFTDWPPLPPLDTHRPVNCEYFGLELRERDVSLASFMQGYQNDLTNFYDNISFADPNELAQQAQDYMVSGKYGSFDSVDPNMLPYVFKNSFMWHFYRSSWLSDHWEDKAAFPHFEPGWTIRPEYDYMGADASVDCYINPVNIAPGIRMDSDWIYWQASAKAFGYLDDPDGSGERRTPVYFGLVLPAFHDVRLIHNNMSGRKKDIRYPGFDVHIYVHLPAYMEQGSSALHVDDCWYCRMLKQWEDAAFRDEGIQWIESHQSEIDAGACDQGRGGGGAGSGGGGAPNMGSG